MNYKKIKQIIDEWDPVGLLAMDSPTDEYIPEISVLVDIMNKKISIDKNAKIIYDVFTKMFGADTFVDDMDKCKEIATKILNSFKT